MCWRDLINLVLYCVVHLDWREVYICCGSDWTRQMRESPWGRTSSGWEYRCFDREKCGELIHKELLQHIVTFKVLITAFATPKSSLTINYFLQWSLRNFVKLRIDIWTKFVEESLLYCKVRSTACSLDVFGHLVAKM